MRLRTIIPIFLIAWTGSLILSLTWNIRQHRAESVAQTTNIARSIAQHTAQFRHWNVRIGGVYALVGPKVTPDPYLSQVPDRDLVTIDGRTLTLINAPAMLRQVSADNASEIAFTGQIKSLDPYQPGLVADRWEQEALRSLAQGGSEYYGELTRGSEIFRYMLPLYADALCLKSRSQDKYQLGDLIAGLSVTIPLNYFSEAGTFERSIWLGHLAIWLLGVTGISWSFARFHNEYKARAAAEETSRTLGHREGLILASAGEGIFGVDLEGRYTFLNPAAARMLGYRPEELLGLNNHTACHHSTADGEPYPEASCPIFSTLRNGEISQGEGEYFWRKDHTSFPISYTSQPMLEKGKIVGAVITFMDISDRVEARQQLHEQKERLDAIFNQAAVGMAQLDMTGHWRLVNDKLCRITGYPREKLEKMSLTDLTHPDDLRQDHQSQREKRFLHQDGSIIHANVTASFIRNHQGQPESVILTVEDITSHKKSAKEQELLQRQFLQAQKMESVGQLAGGVAHDFNNLLTVIINYADFALEQVEAGSQLAGDLLQVIKAGHRATDLTRQLLAFSRKQHLEMQAVDLNALTGNLAKMLERMVGEAIALEIGPDEATGNAWGDPGQLEQVLMNLVINARDAMLEGGKIIITTGNFEMDEIFCQTHPGASPGSYAVLSVQDSGTGIPEALRQKIFEPFFTTKGLGKGTGLGLSTVYGIIKQHGGYIAVDSEVDQGSLFRAFIPLAGAGCRPGEAIEQEAAVITGRETILLVEDDELLLTLIERQLAALGYSVLSAADAYAARILLAAHAGHRIDLLLTDVILPGTNGPKLALELRDRQPNLKVLFMSGYTDEIIGASGVNLEEEEFITKPLKIRDLALKIRRLLDGS